MRERTSQLWDETTYHVHNWSWFAHKERIEATVRIGCDILPDPTSIADLSAGGTDLTPRIARYFGLTPLLSDLSYQYGYDFHGPMETIVEHMPHVDLFVCSETIEHLEDPSTVMRQVRSKADRLLLSTPILEKIEVQAHGHLWVWDKDGVEELLTETGWKPTTFEAFSMWGIWVCE